MKIRKVLFALCVVLLFSSNIFGQRKMTREEYINTYKDEAINGMREYKIPASITLAQGILESGCGGSILAVEANNHFGIKCHEWSGKSFFYDDDEKDECFRFYTDARESFHDHSIFLTTRDRYKPLFSFEITDYVSWAHGLKKAGYATNPQYAHLLIKIIEEQNLSLYDQVALNNGQFISEGKKQDVNISEQMFIPKTNLPEYRKIKTASCNRDIYENNGIKFVFAKINDSYYRIAQDFDIYSYQLFNYNEKSRGALLEEGEIVYLEKKKKKGVVTHYFVQSGESIFDIAQKTGITTKSIYKKNRIDPGTEVSSGTMLWLTKKKP